MALVTTFMTSPIVSFIYPSKYRQRSIAKQPESNENNIESIPKLDKENYIFRALLLVFSPDGVPYIQKLSNLLFGSPSPNFVQICKIVIITERDSTLFNATRGSLDRSFAVISPLVEYFSQYNNLKINSERIISTSDDLPIEIIEAVSSNDLNFILLPWIRYEEEGDRQFTEIIIYLLHGCPATLALYIPCRSLPVSGTSGKILVPFFGGENDIEAIFMGINFSQTTPVVISHYYCAQDGNNDDIKFLSQSDKLTLDFVKNQTKENSNIEYAIKNANPPVMFWKY